MDLGLRDKAAIVTGGSHGIGRAIALGLADEGCHAVICARGEERLRKAAREIEAKGVRALPVAADITKAEDMERLVQATVEAFGRIDILVNNASAYVAEDSDAAWQSTFETNIMAIARLTRLVTAHMQRAGNGVVIHIASIYGRESGHVSTYNAMKSAVISHAKMMSLTLAPHGIRVNAVSPGTVDNHFHELFSTREVLESVTTATPAGRLASNEDIADAIVFLCSDAARYIHGQTIEINGGMLAP